MYTGNQRRLQRHKGATVEIIYSEECLKVFREVNEIIGKYDTDTQYNFLDTFQFGFESEWWYKGKQKNEIETFVIDKKNKIQFIR